MPTPVVLWRAGNASSPRMDNVRPQDVTIYDVQGVEWVQGGSGGISTFATAPPPGDKNWWSLPAGSVVPAGLTLVNDHGAHYLWGPAQDMTLAAYKQLLLQVGPWTRRVVELPEPVLAAVAGPTPGERSSGVNWSPKTSRFVLAAIDAQIEALRAQAEDETADEDARADATNDLVLYQMIRQSIEREASAGPPRAQGVPDTPAAG